MSQLKWIWNYMKGKRTVFTFGLILAGITSMMCIINPMLAQRLIDDVITPRNIEPLIPLLIIMLTVQVSRLGLRYLMIILMEISSTGVMTKVRKDMYETVQHQDHYFHSRFPTGNMMTCMTQDLDRLRHTLAWVTYQLVDAIVLFISTFTLFLVINWKLALCLAAATPFIYFISARFKKRIRPRFQLLRKKLTDLGKIVTENIDGNRVVKAFVREEYEKEKFEKYNSDFRDTSCGNALITAKYQPMLETASQFLIIVTLVVGGYFLIREQSEPGKWMTLGQYLAFSSLTWALAGPLRMMGPLLADMERYTAAGEMIREVIEAPKSISDTPGAVDMQTRPSGKIEFRNVNLSINKKQILENINFTLEAGSTTGILGSTGAGKTSLVNCLGRFFEPDSGQLFLDDIELKHYTLSSLRRYIGFAMQDVFLFSDSAGGNISYGRPDMEGSYIQKHAVQADADSFICKMSDGYDTLVGERGVGLSGGQRQRIALARALAVKPAVLILDDTTSAVDSETEQYIQDQLRLLDFPCTKIIIAQRISSFRCADLILVMDKGRIIERGTHGELIKLRGFYHHIFNLQNNAGIEAVGTQPEAGAKWQ
jgi:ATP-binding cassette subfamily B protein